jgi:hypothetical protein
MEKYCITLDQAKRLYELGASVKFEKSENVWVKTVDESGNNQCYLNFIPWGAPSGLPSGYYPAYHVGELGEILGNYIDSVIFYSKNQWSITHPRLVHDFSFPTEAQARGQLLIHLLENNLL